jgi:hypothetical protein
MRGKMSREYFAGIIRVVRNIAGNVPGSMPPWEDTSLG